MRHELDYERCEGLASELTKGLLVYVFRIDGKDERQRILSPAQTARFHQLGNGCRCGHCPACFVANAINEMEDYFPIDKELDQAWIDRWT